MAFDGQNATESVSLKHCDDLEDICFSPNGQFLVVGAGNSNVQLWDWANKKLIAKVKGCCKSVSGFAHVKLSWAPDSSTFVTRWEKTCKIYNTSGKEVKKIEQGDDVHATGFSPSGDKLFISSKKVTNIFNASSGERIMCIGGAAYDNQWNQKIIPVWCGDMLCARWDKTVRIWNTAGK